MRFLTKPSNAALATAVCMCVACADSAGADEAPQILRIENDMDRVITFRLRSEKPRNPRKPWTTKQIKPDQQAQIRLVSPDRFIASVHYEGAVFTTKPMPLKKALAKNPKRVLMLSMAVQTSEPAYPSQRDYIDDGSRLHVSLEMPGASYQQMMDDSLRLSSEEEYDLHLSLEGQKDSSRAGRGNSGRGRQILQRARSRLGR